MEQGKKQRKYIIMCFLCALVICFAQVTANSIFIAAGILIFVMLSVEASFNDFVTPVLLFFLPWSTILKLQPGGTSFYTIALVASCAICFVKSKLKFNSRGFVTAMLILLFTLFAKLIGGGQITMSYLMFIFLLLLLPVVIAEIKQHLDFKTLTIFFSIGIITAAISAQQLANIPTIAHYIDVYNLNIITRMSGYYGDANFYSAHISAAFCAVLLLILKEKNKRSVIGFFALAITLLYCGFISASKSFTITIAIVSIMWFVAVLSLRGRRYFKIYIIFAGVVALFFVFTSGLFSDLLDMVAFRFNQSSNISDFTTGRTERWNDYIIAITNSPRVLLFGEGFEKIMVNDLGSHSTPIQLIYQFGILGAILVGVWFVNLVRIILAKVKGKAVKLYIMILLVGAFLPWLSIDLLFFDEFFLMPVFVCTGIAYFAEHNEQE